MFGLYILLTKVQQYFVITKCFSYILINSSKKKPRLSPEQQQNILDRAAEQLKTSELSKKAWDLVCADLTNSERVICQMVLEGKMLKEICIELNKSESNITSQRSHIRKKLNMDRKDDLRRELEKRFYEARKVVEE